MMDRPPQSYVDARRRSRMDFVDDLPAELRKLVHEYGLPVVKTCLELGIRKPRHIRHLVETVLDNFSPTRGCYSKQGIRTEVMTSAE